MIVESFTTEGVKYFVGPDAEGRLSCACKDYIFRRRAAGQHCKHIEDALRRATR